MKSVSLGLTQFAPLVRWRPQLGDLVIQHGLFTHWFGFINGINAGNATIVKAGLPYLLVTMSEADIYKNQIEIKISKISSAARGKFAVLQITNGTGVWYV